MWLDPGLAPTFLPWSGLGLFSDWLMSLKLELWLVQSFWCRGRVRPQATHTAALRRIIRAWEAEWCDAFLDSLNARQIFERAAHFLSEIEDDRDNRWGWIVLSPSSATPPEDSYKIIPRHRHRDRELRVRSEEGHSWISMLYIYHCNSAQCSPHLKISKRNVPVFVWGRHSCLPPSQ